MSERHSLAPPVGVDPTVHVVFDPWVNANLLATKESVEQGALLNALGTVAVGIKIENGVGVLGGRIDAVGDKVTAVGGKIDTLGGTMTTGLGKVEAEVRDSGRRTRRGIGHVVSGVKDVGGKVDAVTGAVTGVGGKIDTLGGTMTTGLGKVEAEVRDSGRRTRRGIGHVVSGVKDVKSSIDDLSTKLDPVAGLAKIELAEKAAAAKAKADRDAHLKAMEDVRAKLKVHPSKLTNGNESRWIMSSSFSRNADGAILRNPDGSIRRDADGIVMREPGSIVRTVRGMDGYTYATTAPDGSRVLHVNAGTGAVPRRGRSRTLVQQRDGTRRMEWVGVASFTEVPLGAPVRERAETAAEYRLRAGARRAGESVAEYARRMGPRRFGETADEYDRRTGLQRGEETEAAFELRRNNAARVYDLSEQAPNDHNRTIRRNEGRGRVWTARRRLIDRPASVLLSAVWHRGDSLPFHLDHTPLVGRPLGELVGRIPGMEEFRNMRNVENQSGNRERIRDPLLR